MRRELSNLWDQVASEENGPLSFMTPKQIDVDVKSSSLSPVTPERARGAPNSETPMNNTPTLHNRLAECGLSDECNSLKDNPINKSVLLIEGPQDHVQSGDAKWYSNPLIEHSGRSGDSNLSEHYFEDCTPEKRRRIFSRFTPDLGEPVEWMSVKSSFTTITADAITPLTNRKRFSIEVLHRVPHFFDLS